MAVIVVLLLAIIVILLGGGPLVLWAALALGAVLIVVAIPTLLLLFGVAVVDAFRRSRWLVWFLGGALALALLPSMLLNPQRAGVILAVGLVSWLPLWYAGLWILDWYSVRRHDTRA